MNSLYLYNYHHIILLEKNSIKHEEHAHQKNIEVRLSNRLLLNYDATSSKIIYRINHNIVSFLTRLSQQVILGENVKKAR